MGISAEKFFLDNLSQLNSHRIHQNWQSGNLKDPFLFGLISGQFSSTMLTLCSQPAVLFISLLALRSSISSSTPSKHQFTHRISYAALSWCMSVPVVVHTEWTCEDSMPACARLTRALQCLGRRRCIFFSLPLILSHFLHSHVLVVETMSQLTETQFFSLCVDITHSPPPLTFVWPVIRGAFTNVLNQCGTFSTLHQCFCSSTYLTL